MVLFLLAEAAAYCHPPRDDEGWHPAIVIDRRARSEIESDRRKSPWSGVDGLNSRFDSGYT
jgi:hypothetical protein